MQRYLTAFIALLVITVDARSAEAADDETEPTRRVHAFYYPWYANPQTEGHWDQWNQPELVRGGAPRSFPGGDDIGANFFPQLGAYSSRSREDLAAHMQQLRRAGVGAISVSWWGIDSPTDAVLPRVFEQAARYGIQISFHIEPFGGRSAETTAAALTHLMARYGEHPALYRCPWAEDRPLCFVYDSYLIAPDAWAEVLQPDGRATIRGRPHDAVVIGLWVKKGDDEQLAAAGFDGVYTYFATDGFTYGSTIANWSAMAQRARHRDLLFIPSIGPGYDDTRIRPWNGGNRRSRERGAYYDREFAAAIDIVPPLITITSFNEWHEGTQIEPAVPKRTGDYQYEDYQPRAPEYYLDRTRHWVEQYEAAQ